MNHSTIQDSVRRQLQRISLQSGQLYEGVMQQYGLRGFLRRLQYSRHREHFILKGAMMYLAWSTETSRMTKDIDFKGVDISNSVETLRTCMLDIMQTELPCDDALDFDPESLRIEDIIHDGDYQGRRVKMIARIAKSRIHVHLDIGFDDPIVPQAQTITIPDMLEGEGIELRGYTMESLAAEKIHAMANLGAKNSRIKDFFDVSIFLRQIQDRALLMRAIRTTFAHRKAELPPDLDFMNDSFAQRWQDKWVAFLERSENANLSSDFCTVVRVLRAKLEALFSGE